MHIKISNGYSWYLSKQSNFMDLNYLLIPNLQNIMWLVTNYDNCPHYQNMSPFHYESKKWNWIHYITRGVLWVHHFIIPFWVHHFGQCRQWNHLTTHQMGLQCSFWRWQGHYILFNNNFLSKWHQWPRMWHVLGLLIFMLIRMKTWRRCNSNNCF